MGNNLDSERKPLCVSVFKQLPPLKRTFIDEEKPNGEVVTLHPNVIDWARSKQLADFGKLIGKEFEIHGEIGYSSYTELIGEIRRRVPEVSEIKTMVLKNAKGRVVIY